MVYKPQLIAPEHRVPRVVVGVDLYSIRSFASEGQLKLFPFAASGIETKHSSRCAADPNSSLGIDLSPRCNRWKWVWRRIRFKSCRVGIKFYKATLGTTSSGSWEFWSRPPRHPDREPDITFSICLDARICHACLLIGVV